LFIMVTFSTTTTMTAMTSMFIIHHIFISFRCSILLLLSEEMLK
jgi:hypothetical protein